MADAMADLDEKEFSIFLTKNGLSDDKWLLPFQNMGITDPDQVLSIEDKDKTLERLSIFATPTELISLKSLLSTSKHSVIDKVHRALHEVGLDVAYWSRVFAKQVGVISVQGMHYAHDEFYPHVVQFARSPKEQKALQKLLKMETSEIKLLEQYERYAKVFKERKIESLQMIKKMKEYEGEKRCFDEREVQDLSQRLLETLQVPKEFWFSENTYEGLIDQLEAFYNAMDTVLDKREVLTDAAVIRQASGGQALRGVLIKSGDELQVKDFLVEVPEGISLEAPFHSQHIKLIHVQEGEEESVTKRKEWELYSKKYLQKLKRKDTESLYCSTLKCFVVPLASCFFKTAQLKLSDGALVRIRKIAELGNLDVRSMQAECRKFFNEFGSHVNLGPFHFGGRYEWHCFTSGLKQTDLSKAEHLHREAIRIHGSMSKPCNLHPMSVAGIPGMCSESYPESLYQQTFIEAYTCGGPQETLSLALWKNHLMAENTSWVLLDSGAECTPVWEIIERNHADELENASELALNLHEVWEHMNDDSVEQGIYADAKDLVNEVTVWNEKKDTSQCKRNLSKLLKRKDAVLKKELDMQVWPTSYLSYAPVQEYLKFIIDDYVQKELPESETIRYLLHQVVGPSELELIPSFQDRDYVRMWMFKTDKPLAILKCKDLKILTDCFKIAQDILPAGTSDNDAFFELVSHPGTSLKVTSFVTKTLTHIRNHFRKTDQVYDDVFITTLLFPFNFEYERNIFLHCLSYSDISFLANTFEKQLDVFFQIKEQNDLLKLQAHLIILSFDIWKSLDVATPRLIAHLKFVYKMMSDCICPEIEGILKPVTNAIDVNIESARTSLQYIMQAEAVSAVSRLEETKALFSLLQLSDMYPQKMTLRYALEIRDDTLGVADPHSQRACTRCSDPKLYHLVILHRIMSFDHRCHIKLTYTNSATEGVSCIHPMDGLLAVLHCADNFLRQELLCRLALCQTALPLVLPDPLTGKLSFLLWAMRLIIKQWKSDNDSVCHEVPIISYRAPIISFLRFGKHRCSKSHTVNMIIHDSGYSTFFHYNCDGGTVKHKLVAGLIEAGWYFPSATNNTFQDAVTFLNMHGDARNLPTQIQFLSKISFMCFVFLNGDDLDERGCQALQSLSSAPGGLVMLQTRLETDNVWNEKYASLIPKESYRVLEVVQKNEAEIKECISAAIVKCIERNWRSESKSHLTIEECKDVATECGISTDEDIKECQEGKQMANEVVSIIMREENPKNMLPLQGAEFWLMCAKMDKERYRQKRSEGESVSEYSLRLRENITLLRNAQLEHTMKLNPLMKSFLDSLLNSKGTIRNYYLQWLKMRLDQLSRENLPHHHRCYHEKRKELDELQKAKAAKTDIEKCKGVLEQLNLKLVNDSFGLEHLLREIGQMFEAINVQENFPESLKLFLRLPTVAAELLIEGYPIELMDGDAAHVPIAWVSAVLEEAQKILHDPAILVLSILGLQSSGKSTLLNAAFGVNFNVSAGRCTRGAFMQLLPVHYSLQLECNCRYILLVDTEGLRAPELDAMQKQDHDNQLATFVIGLSNLTVINIFGEAHGDMDDILQTSVHAFIRMKAAKRLTPGCHFVYQNVAAVMARDKGMMGRSKTKAMLDEMTQAAAKEEMLENEYHSFNDVIKFNDGDILYFPNLWVGNPPMAPVNPEYSISASSLRSHLICFAKQLNAQHNIITLSCFKTYLQQFWRAILHENFIFSFKNTLEVSAYSVLECQRSKWFWSFRKDMLTWEHKFENEIHNCRVGSDFLQHFNEKKTSLLLNAEKKFESLNEEMATFFEERPERQILIIWKGETERELSRLHNELRERANQHCQQVWQNQMAQEKINEIKRNHRSVIVQNVMSLVSCLEVEPLDDTQLELKFEEQWKKWVEELEKMTEKKKFDERTTELTIELDIKRTLEEHFESRDHSMLIQKQNPDSQGTPLKEWGCVPLALNIKSKHINFQSRRKEVVQYLHSLVGWSKKKEPWRLLAEQETEHYLDAVDRYLKSKQNEDYHCAFVTELLQILQQKIHDFKHETFTFTLEYRMDISLTACGYALTKFKEMAKRFRDMRDPVKCLEKERETYFQLFCDMYIKTAHEKIAANVCHKLVKRSVQQEVIRRMSVKVTDRMRKDKANDYLFTKRTLIKKVLFRICSELQKGKFDHCSFYLRHPAEALRKCVKVFTEEYCDSGHPTTHLVTCAMEVVTELMDKIISTVKEVTVGYKSSKEKIQMTTWIKNVGRKLSTELKIDFNDTGELLQLQHISNIDNFSDELMDRLKSIQDTVIVEFQNIKSSDIENWDRKPYDLIYEDVSGCMESCPFCKEPCNKMVKGHDGDHTVDLHRPQCLGGWRIRDTQKMSLETCTEAVANNRSFYVRPDSDTTHPYRACEDIYPGWHIQENLSLETSLFWKYVVAKFKGELAQLYSMKEDSVPDHWLTITFSHILDDL